MLAGMRNVQMSFRQQLASSPRHREIGIRPATTQRNDYRDLDEEEDDVVLLLKILTDSFAAISAAKAIRQQ